MHILYEEDGGFKAGKLLSESDASVQVEAASGKRSKIRNNSVVLRFERPSAEQLIPEAQALAETFDLQFLWECAPQDEFDISALAAEYFGHAPSPVEYTALLLRVHGAPAYFHRRGKGRYRPAPPEVLQAAIAALERKQRQAEQVEAWAQAMASGQLPPEIARQADNLLIRPDKNSLEWKALDAACNRVHSRPDRLLLALGAWPHAQAVLRRRLLAEHFPRGTGFAPATLPAEEELPLSDAVCYSIDDVTTTEIDDAISVTPMADGRVRFGIHIAAPGLSVTRDSALDQLARHRMSTVYMPGDKIPMQPDEVISRHSLDAGRPVAALSLYVLADPASGHIVVTETRVERIVVARNLRLHELVHLTEELLGASEGVFELSEFFRPLWQFTLALSAERDQVRGRPESSGKVEFSFYVDGDPLDPDNARVRIVPRRRNEPVDRMVAEMAILANRLWGMALAEAGIPAIYRSQSGFGRVRMSTSALPHDTIGVNCYAWCTSPLRRYVDLVNQWQLIALARHGVSAKLVAPFKPRDADLFAIISQFEAKYSAYADFQQAMERWWCLRWLRQEGLHKVEAVVIKEDLVRLRDAPLITRIPGLPLLERGQAILLEVLGMDELDLTVELRYLETLAGHDEAVELDGEEAEVPEDPAGEPGPEPSPMEQLGDQLSADAGDGPTIKG